MHPRQTDKLTYRLVILFRQLAESVGDLQQSRAFKLVGEENIERRSVNDCENTEGKSCMTPSLLV